MSDDFDLDSFLSDLKDSLDTGSSAGNRPSETSAPKNSAALRSAAQSVARREAPVVEVTPRESIRTGVSGRSGSQPAARAERRLSCPHCGGADITTQVMQEDDGEVTVTKTKSKYKEKGHGFLWWIFIGWWWWMFDLLLWIFLFIPRLLMHAGRRKKYKGKSTSVSTTTKNYTYKTVCLCQNCGHSWTR